MNSEPLQHFSEELEQPDHNPTNYPKGFTEYSNFRDENDKELRIGLFGDDLIRAIEHPDTLKISYEREDGEEIEVPALVPIGILEWYNTELIKRTYGSTENVFVYVHPPVNDEATHQAIASLLIDKIDSGCVVVTEKYPDDINSPIAAVVERVRSDPGYVAEAFGGTVDSRVDFFAGKVELNNSEGNIEKTPLLPEIFEQAVLRGEMTRDIENGPDIVATIDGEEAEEIWNIYEKPFEGLGANDPTLAGFDKESLMDILKDPNITKIINRVGGEITTLMIFLQDFEKAPWFNIHKFKENFGEYVDTNNVLIFPGIVSDENKRGNNYSMQIIDFMAELMKKRGSDFLITFECTEESTMYIPAIIKGAVENSNVLKVTGLDEPIGVIQYFALSKKESIT